MPNIGGARSGKRRSLADVSSSILRCGVPGWTATMKLKQNRTRLTSSLRLMTIRVASAYRTISSEAVCGITGMILICIILTKDLECFQRREIVNARKMVRIDSLDKLQEKWDNG